MWQVEPIKSVADKGLVDKLSFNDVMYLTGTAATFSGGDVLHAEVQCTKCLPLLILPREVKTVW